MIADDEAVVRGALEELIQRQAELELVGAAADADGAIELASRLAPDVVLLDVRMPGGGGVRAAREIAALPHKVRTVAFSAYDDPASIVSMLEAGASGYLVKGASNRDIIATLLGAAAARGAGTDGTDDSAPPTSVLVADRPSTAREGVLAAIEASPELRIVAIAGETGEALRLACTHRPEVVLVNRALAGEGAHAVREIRQAVPDTRILVYSAQSESEAVLESLRAGATSYLATEDGPQELVRALDQTARGGAVLSPEAADAVASQLTVRTSDSARQRRRERLREQLSRFIAGDGLEIVLQPIFDLTTGRPAGVEALSRFAGGGGPSVWFAAAADHDLTIELELAAIRKAMEVLEWLPPPLWISLNASPATAASSRLLDLIGPAGPGRVLLEVTEHAAVDDYDSLFAALTEVRNRGARVAIDDAGAGFAGLRHVLQLEPECIKLDIALCAGIAGDHRRRALARALTAFAAETGSFVIAEGIEAREDLRALRELGVVLMQGFHLARPAALNREQLEALRVEPESPPDRSGVAGELAPGDLDERWLGPSALREIYDESPDGVLFTIPDGRVLAANPAACEILGRTEREICALGRQGMVDTGDERWPALLAERSARGVVRGVARMIRGDGRMIEVEVSSKIFPGPGGSQRVCTIFRDVTERVTVERQLVDLSAELRELSLTDELTGLNNRRGFVAVCEQLMEVADRQGIAVWLMFLDVDELKEINDELGHSGGDAALRAVAGALREVMRRADTSARIGGDEFVALALGLAGEDRDGVSERIEARLLDPATVAAVGRPVRVSIGWAARTPRQDSKIEDLLAAADREMYRAKGRSTEPRGSR